MATFRFRLEPVLDQRKRAEERAQRVVADLDRERLALEDALRARHGALADCKADLRDALAPGSGTQAASGPIDLRGVRMQSAASFRIFADAQRLALRLAGAYQRVEAARADLRTASTARKAVDLLKQKRFDEWKRDQDKREAAATDELAVMRFGREGSLGAAPTAAHAEAES